MLQPRDCLDGHLLNFQFNDDFFANWIRDWKKTEKYWVTVWDNSSLCSKTEFLDAFRKAALSKHKLETIALPLLSEQMSWKTLKLAAGLNKYLQQMTKNPVFILLL